MAKVMATEGYLEAGYQYIIIDDCWPARDRAADGQLVPEPSQFPNGIKSLADYVMLLKIDYLICFKVDYMILLKIDYLRFKG